MLRMAKVKVNKTTLLYQANLNYSLLQKYLAFLLERGLLEEHDSYYRTTSKGMEFLATLSRLQALLEDESWNAGVQEVPVRGGAGREKAAGKLAAGGEASRESGDLWCRVIKILPSDKEAERFLEKEGFLSIEKENLARILERR
ncbi:MAG: hypothetical protein GXO66_09050 [Euryarchaeota archaeon]|nr:hypothetical protein [Euryarchaeota archaeon]